MRSCLVKITRRDTDHRMIADVFFCNPCSKSIGLSLLPPFGNLGVTISHLIMFFFFLFVLFFCANFCFLFYQLFVATRLAFGSAKRNSELVYVPTRALLLLPLYVKVLFDYRYIIPCINTIINDDL